MPTSLKLIFAGTPEFAATHLERLITGPHEVVSVLTQPDRRAGRGKQLQASPVKKMALSANLPVWQPDSLKSDEAESVLRDAAADLMIVVAYGLILPASVLTIPRLGCVNVHASLLPRWRGAAPVQRAIESGDGETGVSIMAMEPGLDTGPVLSTHSLTIRDHHTGGLLLMNWPCWARLRWRKIFVTSNLSCCQPYRSSMSWLTTRIRSTRQRGPSTGARVLRRCGGVFAPLIRLRGATHCLARTGLKFCQHT